MSDDSFNRTPINDLHRLRSASKAGLMVSQLTERDFATGWRMVAREPDESDERDERLLMACGRGGLGWLFAKEGRLTGYRIVPDDEARELWQRLILQFTDAERQHLAQLHTRAPVRDALSGVFGARRIENSQPLTLPITPVVPGTPQLWVIKDGGVLRITRTDDDTLHFDLIVGAAAWEIVQPIVDP